MNIAHALGASALVAALALALVGCNQTSKDAKSVITVDKEHVANTEVCNSSAWIRERASAGICGSTPVVNDYMNLRRLHEELEQSEQ